jgi:leucyl aminopeptidase
MGCQNIFQKIVGFIIAILVGIGILAQPTPEPISEITPAVVTITPTPTKSPLPTLTPTGMPDPETTKEIGSGGIQEDLSTPTPKFSRPEPGSICPYDPLVSALMEDFNAEDWLAWIEVLSGEKPAQIKGESVTILTRWSESMFDKEPHARAYEFLLQTVREWGFTFGETLFEHTYKPFFGSDSPTWKNLVIVLPGTDPALAEEEVWLTAHLDSTTFDSPEDRAPGADDNGTGVATLIEAIRILKDHPFKRTIRIIFFTGEEIGLKGSIAYVTHNPDLVENIVGVINLDMFGYDGDDDRCFEMHVGEMEDSNFIGGCLADTIEAYDIEIKFDYLVEEARGYSDHSTFWNADVGAIEVLENFDTHGFEDGCGEADKNPYYHTEGDLVSEINVETAHRIALAAIAAIARLAEPVEP